MSVEIRPATESDIPRILELIRGLAEYEKLEHELELSADRLAAALRGETTKLDVLIAWAGGEAIGYASVYATFDTFACKPGLYLEDVFVRPEHRGRGAGLALLRAVAKLAVSRGAVRVRWIALDWNKPAHDFYGSIGADLKKEWQLYYLEGDALAKFAGADAAGNP